LPKCFKQVFYEEYRRFPNKGELIFAKNEIIVNKFRIKLYIDLNKTSLYLQFIVN